MKRSKKFLPLIIALVLMLSLCACGNREDSTSDNEENAVKVTILNNKIEIESGLLNATKTYQKIHPNVEFEIVSLVAEPYNAELKTRFAGGEKPDIFALSGYSDMVLWKDYLEDLSDQPWTTDMVDIAYNSIDLGGIYGMPLCVEGGAYMYNKTMFENAGIESVPTTYSELLTCMKKLEAAGYTPLINDGSSYGRAYYGVNYVIAMQKDPLAFMAGLADGTTSFANAPLAKEIMEYWQWESTQVENMLSIEFLTQVSKFANEEVAITFGGNWNQASFDEINPNLKVGMFPVPMFEDASMNDFMLAGVTTYWGVNKESAVKDVAKDFMSWLVTSEEGQKFITSEMLLIPAFTSFSATAEEIGPLGSDLSEYISAGKVKNFYAAFYPEGGMQTFGEDMQKMLAGAATVDELLVTLDNDWKRLAG